MAPRRPKAPLTWAEPNFFPRYSIEFMYIPEFIRKWFDELLIAICYNQLEVLQQFALHMHTWIDVKDEDKRKEAFRILDSTGRWEALEAFNCFMAYHPDLVLELTDLQRAQKDDALNGQWQLPFQYFSAGDKLRQTLTHDVEKRAVRNGNYKYVLYALYVFRAERPQYRFPLGDNVILNYFANIHINERFGMNYQAAEEQMSEKEFVEFKSTRSAKIRLYKSLRDLVLEHFKYHRNARLEGWGELYVLAQDREVLFSPNPRHRDVAGEFLRRNQSGATTPLQTFLGEICNAMKPYCMPSLLGFKMFLLHMHSLARNVVFFGKVHKYHEY